MDRSDWFQDRKIRATVTSIEDFMESFLWKDMEDEIESLILKSEVELLNAVSDAVEGNPSSVAFNMFLGDLNGRATMLKMMLMIPEIILGLAKEQRDDSRRDKT